jgi:hypothetical protein
MSQGAKLPPDANSSGMPEMGVAGSSEFLGESCRDVTPRNSEEPRNSPQSLSANVLEERVARHGAAEESFH